MWGFTTISDSQTLIEHGNTILRVMVMWKTPLPARRMTSPWKRMIMSLVEMIFSEDDEDMMLVRGASRVFQQASFAEKKRFCAAFYRRILSL